MHHRTAMADVCLLILLTLGLAATQAQAQRYAWATFAGQPGTPGATDGSAARFRNPLGVAVDDVGNVYVADSGNYTVRKVTAAGVVSTLAGRAGSPGSADGSGSTAQFRWPVGVAADGAGAVSVTDAELHTIRQVSAAGVVTTLAGNTGNIGSADGSGAFARFNNPFGVARDRAGVLYVADTYNRTIRTVTAAGLVATLAGLAGNIGSDDGTGSAARFYDPLGVAVDGAGTVYVADSTNRTLRRVTAAGVVTTLAGLAGSVGSADGTGGAARFSLPFGVAVDSEGNLYVTDSRNGTIRKVNAAGVVTTIGGTAGLSGSTDGSGSAARFASPYGIAVDRAGIVYVADAGNHRISRGTPIFPAKVTGVSSSQADGLWGVGTRIAVLITFSKPVIVTGTPQLTLETGAIDARVDYTSGSGTTTLTFLYTVAEGQTTPDLDGVGASALALHGGAIRDTAGYSATLTLPAPGTPGSLSANRAIVIDGTVPTLTLASPAPEPTCLTPIPVTATFSQAVSGFDVTDLSVTNGTAGAFAGTAAGYQFEVTPAGQGPVTVRVAAGAGVSAAGNPNRAAAPLSRTYDGLSPTLVDVSSPTRDGIYGPGATLAIWLRFSEPVSVTGAPQLALETGDPKGVAAYVGGSGTATLSCTYIVLAGQASADLDYAGTDALALLGGSIRDLAGNPALLTLPAPGAAHSLAANQALVVAAVGAPNGPFLARVGAAEVAAGRGLWELSGVYATVVDGRALTLNLVHDTRGRVSGTAALLVRTEAGTEPLVLPVRGNVSGAGGGLRLTVRLKGVDAAGGRGASLDLDLALNAAARQLHGPITGSLDVGGVLTPIAETLALALPATMDGTWSLLFELRQSAHGSGGTATLALSNGTQYHLAAQGKVSGSTAVLSLSGLPSDLPAGALHIRAAIETLEGALTRLRAFSGRACGQTLLW